MTTISLPSDAAPALPAISFEVPDNWVQTVYPGALLATFAPRPDGEFRPNVIATSTRHEPGFTLAEAQALLEGELAQLTEASLRDVAQPTEVSVAKGVAFIDPEAGTLVQIHVLVLVDQGACIDMVHLTTSCSAGTISEDETVLDKIIGSLQISRLGAGA
jgi:hypothetical protein